jgi:hypothetical protein
MLKRWLTPKKIKNFYQLAVDVNIPDICVINIVEGRYKGVRYVYHKVKVSEDVAAGNLNVDFKVSFIEVPPGIDITITPKFRKLMGDILVDIATNYDTVPIN